ncbi:MAG: tripartite tricarboxylate transporter substrate binding protein [Betaproteobacteria bacterium]|jgi:putative tricarboxylic transport membrane protein|nr:tripartite tricarboxylate transporter substrate binding protein [Betaproteobacteria bacterium]MDH5342980.1 tripartite tricarboxylate transporter substrate binding protein [Betaproteobacteria bacterium]
MKKYFKINKLCVFLGLLLPLNGVVWAQDWKPERHVELIVPASAGGSLDNVGRTFHRLWDELKLMPVSSAVVNRAGGGHAIAYNFLNQHAGDPHFLSITSSTLHTSNINGRIKLSYRDFTPLAVMMTEYIAIAVRPDSPLKTGKDLIESLRKDPGGLSLALSSALGGTHHISLGMPLLSGKVDIKKTRMVAFNSTGEAVTALLGGHVDVLSGGTVQIAPHVASGKMRLLAVSAAHRLPGALASGPTWPELGYKGVFENWRGVIGTKDMTAPQVAYWDHVFGTIARSDQFKTLAQKNQWEINYKNSAETRKFLEGEYMELKEVMDFLGLSK